LYCKLRILPELAGFGYAPPSGLRSEGFDDRVRVVASNHVVVDDDDRHASPAQFLIFATPFVRMLHVQLLIGNLVFREKPPGLGAVAAPRGGVKHDVFRPGDARGRRMKPTGEAAMVLIKPNAYAEQQQ